MNEIAYISFPENEYFNYQKRLNQNKIIYTTRVSSEVNKFFENHIYDSYFGKLKVVYVKHFQSLKDHPFLNELNEEQILEINSYINDCGYDVIGLIKI